MTSLTNNIFNSLTYLNSKYNNLTTIDSSQMPNLKTLDISTNQFEDFGVLLKFNNVMIGQYKYNQIGPIDNKISNSLIELHLTGT
jgi:Leucine-rich repeat (LRR) protein